jgi:predicted HicB family RNase H-like nuclease
MSWGRETSENEFLALRVTLDLYHQIQMIAQEEGISVSEWICRIIDKELNK